MSGGTLIALAADEIVMDPNAVLGPVDPQLGQSPAASILTVLERKKPEDIEDQTLILADVVPQGDHPGAADGAATCWPSGCLPKQAAALAAKLATGTWTHDYPIMAEEAKRWGFRSAPRCRAEVYQFMSLYPQPTRTRPRSSTCRCPTGGPGESPPA